MWTREQREKIEADYRKVREMDIEYKKTRVLLEREKERQELRLLGREMLGGVAWPPPNKQMFRNMPPPPTSFPKQTEWIKLAKMKQDTENHRK